MLHVQLLGRELELVGVEAKYFCSLKARSTVNCGGASGDAQERHHDDALEIVVAFFWCVGPLQ